MVMVDLFRRSALKWVQCPPPVTSAAAAAARYEDIESYAGIFLSSRVFVSLEDFTCAVR